MNIEHRVCASATPRRLKLLPPEIVEVVLDLGSGGGKVCYLAAQIVGSSGRVVGVDMNDDMLALARKYQAEMAQRLGSDRVRFLKGHIQDLAPDLAASEDYLRAHPVGTAAARGLADVPEQAEK